MTRSQSRSKQRNHARRGLARMPLTMAIYLAFQATAFAQSTGTQSTPSQEPQPQQPRTLETITVTAQKRAENVQKVPISINTLSTQQLDELHINDFEDYAKLMPTVSIQSNGPGFNLVYMRAVASGGDGNHSGSMPSVGTYLDEQPITTIQGALDLHVYDIERVESLAGPQGTLYGASSEAGTLRIITNKPDPSAFSAGIGLEANVVDHGGAGYVVEGFGNIPVSDRAAVRIVGWNKHDAGFIDNVPGSRTFPSWDLESGNGTITNQDAAAKDYNWADTTGARAALKFNLDENWSIMPSLIAQEQRVNGTYAFDPAVGDLEVTHFYPEHSHDRFTQAALTVQGRIGNFDLTYAFAHLKRDVDTESDYNDYGFWYDTMAGYGAYFYDDDGALINPSQYIIGRDGYTKRSHELRIASPQEWRARFVAGIFVQDQHHDIEQRYKVDGLAADLSVQGWNDTIWLTEQDREDHDEAVFGEISFDITDKLTITGGARHFRSDNGLKGFFGFANGYSSQGSQLPQNRYGEAGCLVRYGDRANWLPYEGAPCLLFDKEVKETGTLGRVNLTYELTDDKMVYATWSEGYRPGGINRRGTLPPYQADYLTNYELGWKTSWLGNRLTFNGAVFEESWDDFQFSILGANGLTEIRNANSARVRGVEMDLAWQATYNLRLSGGFGYYDSKLTAAYCGFTDMLGNAISDCPPGTINPQTGDPVDGPEAPEGARLPVTARVKGNITGRYTWDIGGFEAFVQGTASHEGDRESDLRTDIRNRLGKLPAYTTLDLSAGVRRGAWMLDFYVRNATDERGQVNRYTQCPEEICAGRADEALYPDYIPAQYASGQVYAVPVKPRMFGVRFSREF